jgi:hypothetical protein
VVATNSVWNAIIKDVVSVKSKEIWCSQALMTFEKIMCGLKDIINILYKINLIHFFIASMSIYRNTFSVRSLCPNFLYLRLEGIFKGNDMTSKRHLKR